MTERDKAFQLSGDNFDYLCQFVYDTAGIVLNASKKEMVYRRLTRIIRERKLPSFTAYCNLLKADTEKEQDLIQTNHPSPSNFYSRQGM